MNILISYVLRDHAHQAFLASRTTGAKMRQQVELLLLEHSQIEIDFTSIGLTQSFADEFVGILAYRHGKDVFSRVAFKGCTVEHKKILSFVVSHRLSTRMDLPRPQAVDRQHMHPA